MARHFIDRYGHLFRSARRQVVAKTADYTVTVDDNGLIFTNRGASTAVNFTLPSASEATGCSYRFFAVASQTITVTSNEGIVGASGATAPPSDSIAFSTANEKVGNGLEVVSDGTHWLAFVNLGSETMTPTVTTD